MCNICLFILIFFLFVILKYYIILLFIYFNVTFYAFLLFMHLINFISLFKYFYDLFKCK